MSHFYAEIQGGRGPATRCGTKQGMVCHIRGWNKGIRVFASYDTQKDCDVFAVYTTGGSNNPRDGKLIGRFTG